MTVLVTGAAGYLGRQICASLIRQGHRVRGLDLVAGEADDWIVGSVFDPDVVARAVVDAELVLHAAAITDLWTRERFAYDRVNVVGTCRVLAAARRIGARAAPVQGGAGQAQRRQDQAQGDPQAAVVCAPLP